jgi:cell division protein FtsN
LTQPRKAPRKSGRAPARSGGGTLIGIFIGLMMGALIAAGAAWFFTRANPFQSAPVAPRVPVVNQPPAALPGKPGDRPVVKQDFEFYKILPQGDNVPAAQAPAEAPSVPSVPSVPVVERPVEKLYLQLGAFENAAEADNLKARLALAGVEASSQRGQLPDGRTVHRVRIGPFDGPDELNPVRSRLVASGFNTTVTRAGQ